MTASALRPGDEIRRQPRADVVSDDLGGAVLGIAQPAVTGEALLLAGNVIGYARERYAPDDRFSVGDVDQRIAGVDTVVLNVGTPGGDVHNHRQVCGGESYVQPVVRRRGRSAAGEPEQ